MSVGAIIVIAIAASGILLMRFRKRWLAKINIVFTNRMTELVRGLASGFRHSHACGSEIRKGLPNPGECLSSAQRVRHCAHLQQPMRVGEERARGGLRTQDSREEISAFRTEGRARSYASAIPDSGAARAEGRRCGRIHGAFNFPTTPLGSRLARAGVQCACTERCSRNDELTEQTGTVYLSNAGCDFQTGSKLLKTPPIRRCCAKAVLADNHSVACGLVVDLADQVVCGLNFKPFQSMLPELRSVARKHHQPA